MNITEMPSFLNAVNKREETPGTPDIPDPSTFINETFLTTENAFTLSLSVGYIFPDITVPLSSIAPQYLSVIGSPWLAHGWKKPG